MDCKDLPIGYLWNTFASIKWQTQKAILINPAGIDNHEQWHKEIMDLTCINATNTSLDSITEIITEIKEILGRFGLAFYHAPQDHSTVLWSETKNSIFAKCC